MENGIEWGDYLEFRRRLAELADESGLGRTAVDYLITIAKSGTITPKELSRLLSYNKSSSTRVLNELGERGLVEVIRDEKDKRKRNITLTKAGKKVYEKYKINIGLR